MKNNQNLNIFFNESNQNLKIFLNEKQQSSNPLSTFKCEHPAKAELTFFLQSAQCLLKFAARRKTFQPWTFWGSLWANYSNVENNQTQRFDNLLPSIIEKSARRPVEKIIGLQLSQAF